MKQMQLSWRPGAYQTAKSNPNLNEKQKHTSESNRTSHLVHHFKLQPSPTAYDSDSTRSDQSPLHAASVSPTQLPGVARVWVVDSEEDVKDPKRITQSHSNNNTRGRNGRQSRKISRGMTRSQDSEASDVVSANGLRGATRFKGNSDPFKTFSIDIDARANSIITFFRDHVLTSLYSVSDKEKPSAKSASKDFKENIGAFSDEGAAYGFLARYTLVAAVLEPSLQPLAVAYRYKSIMLLRKKTDSGMLTPTSTNLWHIFLLYASELQARSHANTIVHAKMLRNLFEQQIQARQVDFTLLLYVLFNDHQVTCIFLTPPIFDIHDWIPRVLGPLWSMAQSMLPVIDWTQYPIDPSVDNPTLESIIDEKRVNIQIWWMNTIGKTVESPLILLWMITKTVVSSGQLVMHYLQFRDRGPECAQTQEVRDYSETQQYLALAMLHWGRSFGSNTSICGIPFYDATSIMLEKIKSILRLSIKRDIYPARYENARLWTLYVGAVAERFVAANRGKDPTIAWFNKEFLVQAKRMGLSTWESMQVIFAGFLNSEHYAPDGSLWVQQALDR